MKRRIAIAIVLAITSIHLAAAPTGMAKLYKMKHDNAVARADAVHKAAVTASKRVYVADLKGAIKRALTADKTDEAIALAVIQKAVEKEIAELTDAPKKAAVQAVGLEQPKDIELPVKLMVQGDWVPFKPGAFIYTYEMTRPAPNRIKYIPHQEKIVYSLPKALKGMLLWTPAVGAEGSSHFTSSVTVHLICDNTLGKQGWNLRKDIPPFRLTKSRKKWKVYTRVFDPIKEQSFRGNIYQGFCLLVAAPKEK